MALPKLNNMTYELELPSTGETLQFRPFLVKEQKALLIAQESEDDKQKYPNVHVKMTKWNLKSKEVELLTQWIQSLIIRD